MTHDIDGDHDPSALAGWIDRRVLDISGEPIGFIVDVRLARPDQRPEWLTISTGLLSTPVAVPVHGAVQVGDDVVVAHDRHAVFTAPGDAELLGIDPSVERAIAAHFGLSTSTVGATTA